MDVGLIDEVVAELEEAAVLGLMFEVLKSGVEISVLFEGTLEVLMPVAPPVVEVLVVIGIN